MATKTKPRKETVFSKADLEEKRVEVIKENLGIAPIRVDEDGYYYDGKEFLDKLIEKLEKK